MLVFMRWVALVRLHRNPSSFSRRSCHCAVLEGVLKIHKMAFACRRLSRKPHAGYGTLGAELAVMYVVCGREAILHSLWNSQRWKVVKGGGRMRFGEALSGSPLLSGRCKGKLQMLTTVIILRSCPIQEPV